MNTLTFEVIRTSDDELIVTPWIDGTSLIDLIKSYEQSQDFDVIGGYGGLRPERYRYPPFFEYFMGKGGEINITSDPTHVVVLGCDCGEVGCWPLALHVKRQGEEIRWTDFAQTYRPERNYDGFGPFVFERQAYEQVVRDLAAQLPPSRRVTSRE